MSFLFAPAPQAVLPIEGESNLYFPIHRIYGVARNYAAVNAALGEKTPPSLFLKPADAAVTMLQLMLRWVRKLRRVSF